MTPTPIENRDLELALVDDPELPARETMDEAMLEELARSIGAIGLIEPICVKPVAGRWEVIAGHRRYLASKMAGLVRVPARIYPDDPAIVDAVKLHENTKREDLNAADEAVWFAQLLEGQAGGDVDRLAELVHETRHYVETRLVLLRGDEEIFGALRRREINLAVAQELNKVRHHGQRRNFLEAAIKGGASARMVREWRNGWERIEAAQSGAPAGEGETPAPVEQFAGSSLNCLFCDSSEDPHTLQLVYMHTACRRVIERLFGQSLQGVLRVDAPVPSGGGRGESHDA